MTSSSSTTTTSLVPLYKAPPVYTRIDGKVYDLSEFVDSHPGGTLSIQSLDKRDATIPFLNTYGRDKNAKLLLRRFEVRDAAKAEAIDRSIPKMARVDQRLVELIHKYDGIVFCNVPWLLLRPILIMIAGVYLLSMALQWTQVWGAGVALWAYAIFIEVDLSHALSHNAVFEDPKKNRRYNEYHMMLITGINGRNGFREHHEHHASANIVGFDPALNIPVNWRKDAPSDIQSETDLPVGPVLLLGSALAFPWTTAKHSAEGLWSSKLRQDALSFCFFWTIRTAVLLYLVGPVAMIISYMIPFGLVGLEATTQHFDQPLMLMDEYHKSQMSFVEHQMRSVLGYRAPEGMLKNFPVVALDHVYHHLLPSVVDSAFPQHIKDELDQMITKELGIVPVQRSLWTGLVQAYMHHFGFLEAGNFKGYEAAATVKTSKKANPKVLYPLSAPRLVTKAAKAA